MTNLFKFPGRTRQARAGNDRLLNVLRAAAGGAGVYVGWLTLYAKVDGLTGHVTVPGYLEAIQLPLVAGVVVAVMLASLAQWLVSALGKREARREPTTENRPHMNTITEAEDVQNRRRIRMLDLPWTNRATRDWLLHNGSPQERATYVRRSNRMLLGMVALAVIIVGASQLLPKKPEAAPLAPHIERAGRVLAVDLHETALSTSSSVRTERGVFQVAGAVSWAPGDEATLRVDQDGLQKDKKQLCIASSIKAACFFLR